MSDDLREAFHKAVRMVAQFTWDPANPNHQPIEIGKGKYFTALEVCTFVKTIDEPLPTDEESSLKTELYSHALRHHPDLQADLRRNETYATAATCLSKYIERRVSRT